MKVVRWDVGDFVKMLPNEGNPEGYGIVVDARRPLATILFENYEQYSCDWRYIRPADRVPEFGFQWFLTHGAQE